MKKSSGPSANRVEYCEQFSLAEHRVQGTVVPDRETGPSAKHFCFILIETTSCSLAGLACESPACQPSQGSWGNRHGSPLGTA